MIWLYSVLMMSLLIGSYEKKTKNDILNPIMTFTIPLFISVIVYGIFYYEDYIISGSTIRTYCIGIIAFVLGYLIFQGNKIFKSYKKNENDFKSIIIRKKLDKGLYCFSLFIGALIILYLISILVTSGFSNIIFNLRFEAVYGTGTPMIIEYGMVIVMLYTLIKIYNYAVSEKKNKYQKRRIICLLIIIIFNFCLSMARTSIIRVILCFLYIITFKNKRTRKNKQIKEILKTYKNNLIILCLLFFVFYYIAYATNRLGSASVFDKDFFIYTYVGKQMINFDQIILQFGNYGNGYYTFGFFSRVLDQLNIINFYTFDDFFNPFILTGAAGPVYSFIGPLYFDYGNFGVFFTMLINGLLVGFLYYKSCNTMGIWTIIYAISLYSTFMAFFDYQFMMSDQLYYIALLIALYIYNNKGKIYIKKG